MVTLENIDKKKRQTIGINKKIIKLGLGCSNILCISIRKHLVPGFFSQVSQLIKNHVHKMKQFFTMKYKIISNIIMKTFCILKQIDAIKEN